MEAVREVSDRTICSACGVDLVTVEDFRAHCKLDWHRHNLKRRLANKPPISEDNFEERASDLSSISGSDSDSSDEDEQQVPHRKSRLVVRSLHDGKLVEMWTCVVEDFLPTINNDNNNYDDYPTVDVNSLSKKKSLVLLCHGGHFAGAVFDGVRIVDHKTFHRYVVRKKAGGRQVTHDSAGHAPKSAGASMRRYNEAMLQKDIQGLMASWKSHSDAADIIFLHAPSVNRQTFIAGAEPPFSKDDTRIKGVPFTTRRPTLNEVKRVFSQLFSWEEVTEQQQQSTVEEEEGVSKKEDAAADDDDEENTPLMTRHLRDKMAHMAVAAEEKGEQQEEEEDVDDEDDDDEDDSDNDQQQQQQQKKKNKRKKKKKKPAAATATAEGEKQEEMSEEAAAAAEEARIAYLKAKKKAARQRAKEREKEKKEEEKKAQLEEQAKIDAQARKPLTERELRAAAAEARLGLGVTRDVCVLCGKSFLPSEAFERLSFRYCSVACLQTHKKMLDPPAPAAPAPAAASNKKR